MKSRYTYRLLVQSEETSRNILETALYGLIALSVAISIWQFADQPMQTTSKALDQDVAGQVAS